MKPDWKRMIEAPEWDQRPGRQFILLEGTRSHSGEQWPRRHVCVAYLDKEGPDGFRLNDIQRGLKDGDMDVGVVTHWAPYQMEWPEGLR